MAMVVMVVSVMVVVSHVLVMDVPDLIKWTIGVRNWHSAFVLNKAECFV